MAEAAGAGTTCFRIERKDACRALSPESIGITIDRAGRPAPTGTHPRAACRAR